MSALQARRVSPSLLSRSLEHLLKKDTQALRFKVLLIRRVCSESLKSVQYTIGQYRALDSNCRVTKHSWRTCYQFRNSRALTSNLLKYCCVRLLVDVMQLCRCRWCVITAVALCRCSPAAHLPLRTCHCAPATAHLPRQKSGAAASRGKWRSRALVINPFSVFFHLICLPAVI